MEDARVRKKPHPRPPRTSGSDTRSVVTGISLPREVFTALEAARGYESRSSFITRALRRALHGSPKASRDAA
jgi:metal-responsive CopG/Arc/MetJ family transcriptional regulator